MSIPPASIKRAHSPRRRAARLRLAGRLRGPPVGWFGLAGALIGAMLDAARLEARTRAVALGLPFAPRWRAAPPEPLEGYAAAACLALRGEWPGLADREREAHSLRPPVRHDPPARRPHAPRGRASRRRSLALPSPDLPGLARGLATSEAELARRLLAEWAFALVAIGRHEAGTRRSSSDCGLRSATAVWARRKYTWRGSRPFPGRAIRGQCWGFSPARPYRRPSARIGAFRDSSIPTPFPVTMAKGFKELCAAYSELTARPIA